MSGLLQDFTITPFLLRISIIDSWDRFNMNSGGELDSFNSASLVISEIMFSEDLLAKISSISTRSSPLIRTRRFLLITFVLFVWYVGLSI